MRIVLFWKILPHCFSFRIWINNNLFLFYYIRYGSIIGDTAIYAPPTLNAANSIVYAGALDGLFYAISTSSGNQIWNISTVFPIVTGASVLGDGSIVVGNIDGMLFGLNSTGNILWKYKAGSRTNAPAIGKKMKMKIKKWMKI